MSCFIAALRRCAGYRRLLPVLGLCCLGITVLLVNLYLLHTSPSPWMHAHGGVLPRRFGAMEGFVKGSSYLPCQPLRLAETPGPVTALASFPGSGNTWVRHLLQQATGLLTGSIYNDGFLKRRGFPGEHIFNGSVLVVKVHNGGLNVQRLFRRAVLLIRHPGDAILAEFNRQNAGHVGHASSRDFAENWASFVPDALDLWTVFNFEWLQFTGPLLVIRFEDFRLNLNGTLSGLLRFLNVAVSRQNFECALRQSDGQFKRKKRRKKSKTTQDNVFTQDIATRMAESEEKFWTALNDRMKRWPTRTFIGY